MKELRKEELEKAIDKVKKLLSLSKSDNKSESDSAIVKARKIMMKYKLSMSEIDNSDKNKSDKIISKTHRDWDVTMKTDWKYKIAQVIGEKFGCSLLKNPYGKSVIIVGTEENIRMVEPIINYAIDCCKTMIDKRKKEYKEMYGSVRGVEKSFAYGYIIGLIEVFSKQDAEESGEWGLVVKSDLEKSDEAMREMFNITSKKTSKRVEVIEDLYNEGVDNGKKFSTNRLN